MKKIILIIAALASFGVTAAPIISPGQLTANDLLWLSDATTTQGTLSALMNKPFSGSMTTALGKSIPLPANWSAAIPRATLAASAANVLKRAGGYGLAAYTVYSVLSPMIGLNEDGTVTTSQLLDSYNASYTFNACPAFSGTQTTSGSTAAVCSWMSGKVSAAYSVCGYSGPPTVVPDGQGSCKYSTGSTVPIAWAQIGGSVPVTTSLSESELATRIQNSSATDKALLDAALADSVAHSFSNDMVKILPSSTPATVTASPVVGPDEVVSTAQVQNGDGTTSTVQKKAKTTATPQVLGSTAGDLNLEWQTSTTETTTTTNNSTNATTVSTSVVNHGTTTTEKPVDYGKFSGSDPGDAFADGKAKIQTALCGGNCAQALTCAAGVCSVSERIETIKTKYTLGTTYSGECPAFTFDISGQGYGSHSSTAYCGLAESVRGSVATIITIAIALSVVMIILGA